jgi:hypothetical protein
MWGIPAENLPKDFELYEKNPMDYPEETALLHLIMGRTACLSLAVQVGEKNALLGRVLSIQLDVSAKGTPENMHMKVISCSEETHNVLKCFAPFVQSTLVDHPTK